MLLSKIKSKLKINKSKHGFTLVEALAAVFVLVIVFTGVLNAVMFSRQMTFKNNMKEKASDQAQIIADVMQAAATGASDITDAKNAIEAAVNDTTDDLYTQIGEISYVTTFGYTGGSSTVQPRQYTISDVNDTDTDITASGISGTASGQRISEQGYLITIRVYYEAINDSNDYECVEVTAFAPVNYSHS